MSAIARWCSRLFVIAAVTLGIAYYLPLHRAHRVLTAEHKESLGEIRALDAELAKTRSALTAAGATRDALQASDAAVKAKTEAAKTTRDAALSRTETALKRFRDAKLLSVALRGDQLVVSFSPEPVSGLEALPAAAIVQRLGLCNVTTALAAVGAPGTVSAIAATEPPSAPSASAANAARWELASRRATRVVDALQSSCHLPGAVSAIVRDAGVAAVAPLELAVQL